MKSRKVYQYGIALVLAGVIIGLILSANFNLNIPGSAENPTPPVQEEITSKALNNSALKQFSTAFADIAEKVNPAVVTIFTEKIVRQRQSPFFQFPFEEFFKYTFNA